MDPAATDHVGCARRVLVAMARCAACAPTLSPYLTAAPICRVTTRGYPLLASVPRDATSADFGMLSEKRKLALATFDLCGVCALPFGDELRWQVAFDDALDQMGSRYVFNEPPVHEVCGLYAAQVCPFVSSPYARLGDEVRKGNRRGTVVHLARVRLDGAGGRESRACFSRAPS